ncbi:MAG: hypothetical protein IPF41_02630 [Flavobacteriales bacterium]|nr:hypothetical protein [Flavobacteriales bacterium]
MIQTRSIVRCAQYMLMCVLPLLACTTNRINGPGAHNKVQVLRTGVLHLHATHTSAYCGGADPGPEGMPRPEPWYGPMFLRPAEPDSTGTMAPNDLSVSITDTIRTDHTGHGYRTLPVGSYLLLDADRVNDKRYQQLLNDHAKPVLYTDPIDKACLDRWLHGPFGVVRINGGDTVHVELPLLEQCPWYNTPCVNYHGPLPP